MPSKAEKVNLAKEDTSKPIVNPEYLDNLFASVIEMEVPLDDNPLDYDPNRISSKIQQCRTFLDDVEQKSQISNRDLHTIKSRHIVLTKVYELKERKLFSDDAEVRAPKHQDERKSVARRKLEAEIKVLTWLEAGMEDHKAMLEALKMKRADLKNTQSQLREQIKLCNESLGLGLKWGCKGTPTINLSPGIGQDHIAEAIRDAENSLESVVEDVNVELEELEENDLLGESESGEEQPEEASEELSEDTEESEVENALEEAAEEPETGLSESEEEDLNDLVGGILAGDLAKDSEEKSEPEEKAADPETTQDESEIDSILDSDDMAQAAKPAAIAEEDDDEEFDFDDLLD